MAGVSRQPDRQGSADPSAFRKWLHEHEGDVRATGGGFGNHRKYESLDGYSPHGTGAAVETYVCWVRQQGTHAQLMQEALTGADGDPKQAFHVLYRSMDVVERFGRTARFDYLTMVGKVGLSPIVPGLTYMDGATGPFKGARLLLGTNEGPKALDQRMTILDQHLGVGMQVLEDALCNWQKSPSCFIPFRG